MNKKESFANEQAPLTEGELEAYAKLSLGALIGKLSTTNEFTRKITSDFFQPRDQQKSINPSIDFRIDNFKYTLTYSSSWGSTVLRRETENNEGTTEESIIISIESDNVDPTVQYNKKVVGKGKDSETISLQNSSEAARHVQNFVQSI